MMRPYPRAWTTRATMLLLSALLTAAQAAVFIAPLAPERVALGSTAPARADASLRSRWTYGRSAARFALIEYADLECPYCASSFESIRRWIDAHGDVSWHWRHLPLATHEPQATDAARRAHCIGELDGNEAFWNAIAQHYESMRGLTAAVKGSRADTEGLKECLQSPRADAALRADAEEAARLRIIATPTFVLRDQHTGQHVTLQGSPDESLLLSAIDALLATSRPK